ncbi:MAG: HEPN family nuclease [Candidatus Aminicenantes bacterium]|nr:HEPN family nuclease [Candidatus Aminicenantes bacterium]
MSEYTDFPKDFLKRTQDNLEKYSGKYEITNLINNCLGLIVIPKEFIIDNIEDYELLDSEIKYGISKTNINFENKNDYSLKNIIRHIRNGIAHGRIEQKSSEGKIVGLRIFDCNKENSPENFSIKLSINEMKEFAKELSNDFLKKW